MAPSRVTRSLAAAVATVVLALAALVLPLPTGAAAAGAREITLDARMFAFEPGRLRVNQGDRVTVILHATDVVHGLYIDGYDVDIIAEPGRPAQATFTADKLGKFRYRCSVSCGAMHPFM
ncbi:MAG TPA: cupredoxin domain-containing protein, partial [Anaerolineae bacterium]|nr:cupredoxin domain-containing protein [Anaerolineae bacterium]